MPVGVVRAFGRARYGIKRTDRVARQCAELRCGIRTIDPGRARQIEAHSAWSGGLFSKPRLSMAD